MGGNGPCFPNLWNGPLGSGKLHFRRVRPSHLYSQGSKILQKKKVYFFGNFLDFFHIRSKSRRYLISNPFTADVHIPKSSDSILYEYRFNYSSYNLIKIILQNSNLKNSKTGFQAGIFCKRNLSTTKSFTEKFRVN